MRSKLVISAGVILNHRVPSGELQQFTDNSLEHAVILPDELVEQLMLAFDNLAEGRAWLNTSNPNCQGQTPLDVAQSGRLEVVYRLLSTLEDPEKKSRAPAAQTSDSEEGHDGIADSSHIGMLLRKKLFEYQPNEAGTVTKAWITVVLPTQSDGILDTLCHCYSVSKSVFFTAAANIWMRDFELIYGDSVPIHRAILRPIKSEDFQRLERELGYFRGLLFDNKAAPCNAQISGALDTKLANATFLLGQMGCRVTKRMIIGAASVKLLDELLRGLGPIPISEN